jgi:hypothetical protein
MPTNTLNPLLWSYISDTQKDLINEGFYLLNDIIKDHQYNFKDYSFLVFPFAKAYEGFLKQVFLDKHFISHLDYISDHFRLGKFLSPNLTEKLGERSLYTQVIRHVDVDLANLMWSTWKLGRNQVFHYYPHNTKALSLQNAEEIIEHLLFAMEEIFKKLKPHEVEKKISEVIEA